MCRKFDLSQGTFHSNKLSSFISSFHTRKKKTFVSKQLIEVYGKFQLDHDRKFKVVKNEQRTP